MPFGALIIGDEIMRGKRQDKHMAQLIAILRSRGLTLAWCEYLGDDPELITATLKRTLAGADIVFSFGGIGATPTTIRGLRRGRGRRGPRAASGGRGRNPRPLRRRHHAEPPQDGRVSARREHHTQRLQPHTRFLPARASLRPGFPIMAWPMVEWVLDTRYARLFHRRPETEASIMVYESAESTLTPLMEAVEAKYRGLKVFSLPSIGEGGRRRHIELGVRGAPEEVVPALEELKRGVTETGGIWEAHGAPPALGSEGP